MKTTNQTGRSVLLLACLSLAVQHAAARTFRAVLPEIRTASFYRIALPPHVSAIAGTELYSLRLNNAQGRAQPYLIGIYSGARAKQLAIPDRYLPVPVASFSQTDSSDKRSYLRIRFDEPYPLDRLRLRFEGPRFYSRVIRFPDAAPDWQRRIHQNQDLVVESALCAKELLLVVANDDNPPLQLSAVEAGQKARYLSAWLDPGAYRLEYSDTGTTGPRYDIVVLADSLAGIRLPVLHPGAAEPVDTFSPSMPVRQAPAKRAPTPVKTVLIWCILGGIGIALLFATRALVQRIGTERDDAS